MVYTNFPNGVTSFGVPQVGGNLPITTGNYWFVSSVLGSSGNPGNDASLPFATLMNAVSAAASGDVIVLLPNHAETISAASGVLIATAGLTVIGQGEGASRPTFTFSATASTFNITAASFSISNVIGKPSIDQVVSPFVVAAAGCTLGLPGAPLEWQDATSAIEAIRAILTTAAGDNLTVNLKYIGFPAGSHCVNAIRLVGCNNALLNVDLYGKASTAWVEFLTTLCTNVEVYGYMYNSGTTDNTKDVVDTVTGSTWYASFFDGSAGYSVSGGSAAALASDDVSTVVASQNVPTADSTANVLMRDVVGNKTDAAVTAVGTTKSIEAYAKGLVTMNTVQAADSTNNAFAGDVVGNKTDASVYVPGTTNSIEAYVKGHADLQERVAASATAVMVTGNTIFTVAGGAIKIEALYSICITANDGTASTLQYSVTPTIGTATTISGASASLANAAAGATVTLAGTALATAALLGANGPNLIANPGTILCPAGTIKVTIAVGSTTGTWKHFIRYKPLAVGVTVS